MSEGAPPLHERFLRTAAAHPDRPAVIDPARARTVTYAALADEVRAIAAALEAAGIAPGQRIGVLAPKSIAAVAGILGVLAHGSAYVPADPSAPVARAAHRFRDASVAAMLVSQVRADALAAAWGAELVRVDAAGLALLKVPVAPAPAPGIAYILYTSGSTGEPKGVVHTHASAGAFVDWCAQALSPTPADRFSSHAPFCFDLSILDLFVPLARGAAVVLIGEAQGANPLALTELLARERITVWYSTPSVLRLMLAYGALEQTGSDLRLVLFAGEPFAPAHVARLRALWPAARFFNLYGPTETNVCTAFEVVGPAAEGASAHPIGKVIGPDRARVAPREGSDAGELLVAGGTVMAGYWGRPELDARAFAADAPDTGERWYRTGDLVVVDAAGDYVFCGRADRMVKRLGNRVELGEIEAALAQHADVSEAAVVARPDPEQGVKLGAFVAWRADAAGQPSIIALKRFCAERLPSYMVPDRFVFLERLPKTATDKIDYSRLEIPGG